MRRHATALRAFTHAGDAYAAEQVILDMDEGRFADWSADGVDLVREATDEEVALAMAVPAVTDPAPAPRQPRRARSPKTPAA